MACRNGDKTGDKEFLYIATILKEQLGLCQNLPELNYVLRDSSGGTEAYISVVRP
jgi:hypothetical protein